MLREREALAKSKDPLHYCATGALKRSFYFYGA